MKIKIIRIGNSKGVRLSKMILEKYKIGEQVNLRLEPDHIIIEPLKAPREDWDEIFLRLKQGPSDVSLLPDVFEDEAIPEWK